METMNNMMKIAAKNLAATAGHWNDSVRSGGGEAMNIWNKIYMEKAALLKSMGFEVTPETDEDGFAVAITVGTVREEVYCLFH